MTDYLIKELGSSFVVAADGQDVLCCADENIAHQIVKDAEADCCPGNSILSRMVARMSGPICGG